MDIFNGIFYSPSHLIEESWRGDFVILDIFTSYLFFLKLALILTAVLMLCSNLDDAFVDIYYLIHKIRRRLFLYTRYQRFTPKDILHHPEQHFALMIPTWQEEAVIGAMIKNTLHRYHYSHFHIFVGAYPNDQESIAKITAFTTRHANVHLTCLPHPGPTSKADCLNYIYQDILTFEHKTRLAFAAYILHDAEDIVHPYELKLYNHLIPRKDMVQIPVIPLERPWHDLTGGHYQDEFAENHTKELVVRESLTGHVPSAGVGTALSRRALAVLCDPDPDRPFDIGNLTEDYDLSLRLSEKRLKLIFARVKVGHRDIIATREFFPDTVSAVVRQKSRWLMGIALQGFRRQRWHGPLTLKYALFRDRKGILTAQLSLMAYFILLNIMGIYGLESLFPDGLRYPPLVRGEEGLALLLWINFAFLVNRALHRMWFTGQIYGLRAALLSLPRQLWGNILNALASLRAMLLYSDHLLRGTALTWDKTDHVFPDQAQLHPFRQQLGDLLLQEHYISPQSLAAALQQQKLSGEKLGRILLYHQQITPQQLTLALQQQDAPHDPAC